MPLPIDYQINQLETRERLNGQFMNDDQLLPRRLLTQCFNPL